MTRRAAHRPPTVLAYSEDEGVLASVRLLLAQAHPQAELLCAYRVEDAVSHGTGTVIDLALLDHAHTQRLSPLIRLLRGHSPRVKVVVFVEALCDASPRVIRWEELRSVVTHTLNRDHAHAHALPLNDLARV